MIAEIQGDENQLIVLVLLRNYLLKKPRVFVFLLLEVVLVFCVLGS
jgi:hypothetical protein